MVNLKLLGIRIPTLDLISTEFAKEIHLLTSKLQSRQRYKTRQTVNSWRHSLCSPRHVGLEHFFQSQMGKEQAMPQMAFLQERFRGRKVFRRARLPVLDLFIDIHAHTRTE